MRRNCCFIKRMLFVLILCLSVTTLVPCPVHAKTQTVTSGDKAVDKKAKAIIKKVIKSGMTDAQKVKAIHDYIALNCAYDKENFMRGTIPDVSYTAKGVLLKKTAVCQGYAEAFKLLMDMLNIPCKMVVGTANNGSYGGGHAWNMVKVSGKWYQIDVTWDDPTPDRKGYISYNYFLITDSKMDDTHTWERADYPKCKTDNTSKFIKLIGDVSGTMDEAIDAFYDDYMLHDGSESTIIIKKQLYSIAFNFDLFDGLAERYGIRFYSWRYTHPAEYGKYYIIQYTEFGD